MKTLIKLIVVACFAGAAFTQQPNQPPKPGSRASEVAVAVEATVRDFEQAVQEYNFAKANSFLTPEARWIDGSLPGKLEEVDWPWFEKLKEAGVRMINRPHDFDTHVQGDVAWVTLSVDVTFSTDSAEAQKLLLQDSTVKEYCLSQATHVSCGGTAVESEVLVKTQSGWKIALGHTSLLPKAQK